MIVSRVNPCIPAVSGFKVYVFVSITYFESKSLLYNNDLTCYKLKQSRTITLATADGTKTVGDLLVEAVTTLEALTPLYNASKIIRFIIPYGSGSSTRISILSDVNYLIKSFSNLQITGHSASGTSDSANIYIVNSYTSTMSVFNLASNGVTVYNKLSLVPSNGTKLEVTIEEYDY